jgi:hypothetical protein
MRKKQDAYSVVQLPGILVGVSGEYFVAAELTRQGYIASVTLKNTRGIDVLAANSDASKFVGIQVKTNTSGEKDWMLNKIAESLYSDNLFYVFVNLTDSSNLPRFHVVPSRAVAAYVKRRRKKRLATTRLRGRKQRDNPIRHFRDPENKYLHRWDLLGLKD